MLVNNFKELEGHVRDSLNGTSQTISSETDNEQSCFGFNQSDSTETEHTSEKLFDSGVDLVGADKLFAFADRKSDGADYNSLSVLAHDTKKLMSCTQV